MTEIIYPRDGDAVRLRPCPPWCTLSQHLADDDAVYADDGFHHCGPELAVPTSYRMLADSPESVVKVTLRAWTNRLDAEPEPGHIELQLATTEYNTDMYVDLTPDQARAVSSALLKLADTAARTETK
jgi:hypothetical protein